MAITVKVYRNGIRATAPDSMGARAVTIEAMPDPEFMGAPSAAAAFLRTMPIGQSVEVRYYRGGAFAGLRSCMNKPALWADVEGCA